jgi:hypothetical protein
VKKKKPAGRVERRNKNINAQAILLETSVEETLAQPKIILEGRALNN